MFKDLDNCNAKVIRLCNYPVQVIIYQTVTKIVRGGGGVKSLSLLI